MVKLSQKFLARELRFFEREIEKHYSERKKRIFSAINKKSKVLEIGPGTGVNLKYYPRGLKLSVVEPNPLLEKDLKEKAEKFGIKLNFNSSFSEKLGFKDEEFDFVISTLVLCSVKDLEKSLREIKRVLKKNGKYIFIEHVLDKETKIRILVQGIVKPLWRFFGDGCQPNRDIEIEIKKVFRNVEISRYEQKGLGFIGWVVKPHICGSARKF